MLLCVVRIPYIVRRCGMGPEAIYLVYQRTKTNDTTALSRDCRRKFWYATLQVCWKLMKSGSEPRDSQRARGKDLHWLRTTA